MTIFFAIVTVKFLRPVPCALCLLSREASVHQELDCLLLEVFNVIYPIVQLANELQASWNSLAELLVHKNGNLEEFWVLVVNFCNVLNLQLWRTLTRNVKNGTPDTRAHRTKELSAIRTLLSNVFLRRRHL